MRHCASQKTVPSSPSNAPLNLMMALDRRRLVESDVSALQEILDADDRCALMGLGECGDGAAYAHLAADHLAPYEERLAGLREKELAVHGTNPSQARERKEKST